jgi:hypothetical protein
MDFHSRAPIKGVIYGVAEEIKAEDITENIDEVVGVRRLTCMVDRENKFTSSMLLFFYEESLPSHMKSGFMRYPVRAFVHKPLQCHKCKRFGHVSSVCRREEYLMPDEEKCCNCVHLNS